MTINFHGALRTFRAQEDDEYISSFLVANSIRGRKIISILVAARSILLKDKHLLRTKDKKSTSIETPVESEMDRHDASTSRAELTSGSYFIINKHFLWLFGWSWV